MLLYVVLVFGVTGLLSALGRLYVSAGRARTVDRLHEKALAECKWRLECIAPALGGQLVEGPALRTKEGVLELLIGRQSSNVVIDVTTFTAEVDFSHVLCVADHRDANRALRTRVVRPVDLAKPEIAAGYRVFSTDADFARSVVTRELARALRDLDEAIRARSMLRVAGGKATVVANRGLQDPAELQALHDRAAAVVALVRNPRPTA